MIPEAIKSRLTPGCDLRFCCDGRMGPEYIEGTFVRMSGNLIYFKELGGWREIVHGHYERLVEIDRRRIDTHTPVRHSKLNPTMRSPGSR